MFSSPTIEHRGSSAVGWLKSPRHSFYEDRYRLLCRPIPLVADSDRGEIFVVCDGVGSAPKGMAAAQEVCDCLVRYYKSPDQIPKAPDGILSLLREANDEIQSWGSMASGSDRSQGACAATIIWIDEHKTVAHVFHAGDTSALLIRDGLATALTAPHQSGEGHLINYFGLATLIVEPSRTKIEDGDRLLLLTDGIAKVLYNQHIADIVEGETTRARSLAALLGAARAAGSGDDATALLIDIERD
jgi:serine/threonine protein phosphatase PrpC